MRTAMDLAEKQALPLDLKIMLTQQRIREWVREYGVEHVVCSFSGGKDSTVLLHLVRELYPDVRAVFSNTGLEYPEIQRFVKSFDNVDIVTPKMRFDEVISTYGYPLISKEVAEAIYYARRIRSQDVNVERERAEQASNSTREQSSYSERERQDTQSKTVPHGEMSALHTHTHTAANGTQWTSPLPASQTDWRRIELKGERLPSKTRAEERAIRADGVAKPSGNVPKSQGNIRESETQPG